MAPMRSTLASIDEFKEFNPPVEKLVRDQQKLVAGYVSDAERALQAIEELHATRARV